MQAILQGGKGKVRQQHPEGPVDVDGDAEGFPDLGSFIFHVPGDSGPIF